MPAIIRSALMEAFPLQHSPLLPDRKATMDRLQELRRLREFERRVYRLKGLPANVREAIRNARMDASHDHLNALLDEK